MTLPNALIADRLLALLARYVAEFAVFQGRKGGTTLEVDAAFAALRLQQRLRWPQGAALVDALGACAHDVIEARTAGGPGSPRVAGALEKHARAVRALEDALARDATSAKEHA